ncbi:MAG: OmpA family protein [Candidatus Devosia phytovorans]|uniref:OmpA family protein n=1 Tax=Candidatus Devosia phytovorans TaxID=3121372 RepID=A0AAJ6B3J7_9HYPH|nr:OmpA family protein [Devosia sp.]WEK06518.1 MAG: OmpA family protein [Devosia sp.]
MIRNLIKWVVPGLVTVLGGTSLTLAMTSADIDRDLNERSGAAMAAAGFDWVELAFQGRDLTLSGTTTDRAVLQAAITRLDATSGVGQIRSDVTFAPMAKPYLFEARVAEEGIDLTGGVPDETTRRLLETKSQKSSSMLEMRSGMPERTAFVAGANFAIDNLKYFDQGAITLSDTSLSLNGRAASEKSYRDLLIVMRAGAPAGLTLGEVNIAPALVSPYQWSATFDGKTIAVTGFVPDDASAERLRTAEVGGLPVSTGLALGSGEPQGFSALSERLLTQLARLEYGSVSIDGDTSTITGAPPSVEIAQAVTEDLQSANSIVTLEAPRIADYWMSASKQANSSIVFDGYAPDEATRTALAEHANADISFFKLGRGAPERYQSAVDFGLDALDQMREGRFSLRDNVMSLTGLASSTADYRTLLDRLADGPPQGLILAMSEVRAPAAADYSWSASLLDNGVVAMSGDVPSAEIETALLATAGPGATTSMVYASGEPSSFATSAELGLGMLTLLQDGRVSLDDGAWTITGTPASPAARSEIETRFADQQLAAAGWSMALGEPVSIAESTPERPPATPEADSAIPEAPAVAVTRTPIVVAEPAPEVAAPPAAEVAQVAAPDGVDTPVTEPEPETLAIEPAQPVVPEPAPEAAAAPAQPEPVAAPEMAETPTAPQPVPSSDFAACAAPVAQFSARNAIFFGSGASSIAVESNAALDELAIDLAACPQATVHIEGHTDTDGDDMQNMALSVARAEAVVNALVQRGVAADRLYAVGYGETKPIADNATPEGKRMNRRIVVTVKAGE